jgi:hypothetical protein
VSKEETGGPGDSLRVARERHVRWWGVQAGLAFLMAESVRDHSNDRRVRDRDLMIRLRDCLSYRAEALPWHVQMLGVLKASGDRRLAGVKPRSEEEYHALMAVGFEQNYMFDNLVFNALAAFDYTANFVGFAFYGEQRRKAKWDRIRRYANDQEAERKDHQSLRVFTGRSGPIVSRVHKDLVHGLAEYRASLIHYEATPGPGDYSFSYFGGPFRPELAYDIRIRVPLEYHTLVRKGLGSAEALLKDEAGVLADQVRGSIVEILRALRADLRAEAGLDPDGEDGVVEMIS